MAEYIDIQATDGSGSFKAYVAKPAGGTGPAVVAIQEIFGVNGGMRQISDDLAAQGYIAICPDLFWRQEPGVDITDKSKEEWDKAFSLMQGFDMDKGIEDIAATIDVVRAMDGCSGKVGAVGYCLGGRLAYMTAARTDIDASVSYYGVGIDTLLDEAGNIKKPLMMHIAEEDGFVDKDAQARIHKGLDGHPLVSLFDYAGVDHAFARPDGINWNGQAANLANSRTKEFFEKNLKG
ncbi:dienelactone hydrolase family protein [Kordiimonas marina]|uniref:dienelactone hydrolase family protein n=1 Tax=Kordiimonas marina TaxID=2872312 RepID=UPI001FF2A183|nr:dienelactone hydrolase family protein [Kordiimonas marina]MCJ9429871.1 dienelactone hydrolase family protein [Kordiimonas marina]